MHRKRIFFRSVQKYYYHVQKNCLFLGPCRNITIQGQGVPGFSCRAIFGVRVLIFGEIYTSAPGALLIHFQTVMPGCMSDNQLEEVNKEGRKVQCLGGP